MWLLLMQRVVTDSKHVKVWLVMWYCILLVKERLHFYPKKTLLSLFSSFLPSSFLLIYSAMVPKWTLLVEFIHNGKIRGVVQEWNQYVWKRVLSFIFNKSQCFFNVFWIAHTCSLLPKSHPDPKNPFIPKKMTCVCYSDCFLPSFLLLCFVIYSAMCQSKHHCWKHL